MALQGLSQMEVDLDISIFGPQWLGQRLGGGRTEYMEKMCAFE